jgi:hypothetical protein
VVTAELSLAEPASVRIELVDLHGRTQGVLLSGEYGAGMHRFTMRLASVATGLYLCRCRVGRRELLRPLEVVR